MFGVLGLFGCVWVGVCVWVLERFLLVVACAQVEKRRAPFVLAVGKPSKVMYPSAFVIVSF